jgi:hypothetical protein
LVGPLTITNSTVTDNRAVAPAGATFGGGLTTSTRVRLVYTTIADNAAGTGANVSADLTTPFRSGEIDALATVVANPQSGGADCFFPKGVSTLRFSWITDGSCSGAPDSTSIIGGGDPQLGPLADNGGPTATRSPATTSPLIDAIPVDACTGGGPAAIATDQRGVGRPQADGCDIGAVEVVATSPGVPPVPPAVVSAPAFTG